MADLTKIRELVPPVLYQVEWDEVPQEEKPPECKAPPEQWGAFHIKPINAPEIPVECKYIQDPLIPSPYVPQPDIPPFSLPFRMESLGGLHVKIPGGTIQADNCTCKIKDTFLTLQLPSGGKGPIVWLERKDENGVLLSCCKSSVEPWDAHYEVKSAIGGWDGYPDQPIPSQIKYIELAAPTIEGGEITDLGLTYAGGDFITWPGDEPKSFRVVPICSECSP